METLLPSIGVIASPSRIFYFAFSCDSVLNTFKAKEHHRDISPFNTIDETASIAHESKLYLMEVCEVVEAGEAAEVLVHLNDVLDDGRALLGLGRPPRRLAAVAWRHQVRQNVFDALRRRWWND